MTTDEKIEAKFWKALRSDMTVMLGTKRLWPRPMTAQVDGHADHGPIWFFTSTDTELAQELEAGQADGIMTFVSKGHDIWATAAGRLGIDMNRAMIERLWNPFVAAWYEQGKDDPKLRLVRFDPHDAEIWLDGSSIVAGVKAILGRDPKEDYEGNVARVSLR
jgi:general stress protein 26